MYVSPLNTLKLQPKLATYNPPFKKRSTKKKQLFTVSFNHLSIEISAVNFRFELINNYFKI